MSDPSTLPVTTTLAAVQLADEMRKTGKPPVESISNTGAVPAEIGQVWYSCALSGASGTIWLNNVDETRAPDPRNNTLSAEMIPIVALSWWVGVLKENLDDIILEIISSPMAPLSEIYHTLTGNAATSMWSDFTAYFNGVVAEVEIPLTDDPFFAWLTKPVSQWHKAAIAASECYDLATPATLEQINNAAKAIMMVLVPDMPGRG